MSDIFTIKDNLTINDFVIPFGDEDEPDIFLEENALAYLLIKEIVFINSFYPAWKKNDGTITLIEDSPTTAVFVLCNDLFMWGCADAEPVETSEDVDCELYDLLKMELEDPKWGVMKWCALHRDMAPQSIIVKDMIKDGAWDERMHHLHNPIDEACCDWHRNTQKENNESIRTD